MLRGGWKSEASAMRYLQSWKDKHTGEAFKIIVPQIISHSMFSRVQARLKKNTRLTGNNRRKHVSLLSDFQLLK